MPQTPPPYVAITGISRTVMKDNAQETLVNYDGNARPGEIVADLTVDPPALYIGNNLGQLTAISGGGGVTQIVAGTGVTISPAGGTGTVTINSVGGNAVPGAPVNSIQFNSANTFGGSANLTFANGNLNVGGDILPLANNISNIGSPTAQFKDLYLSNATLYFNSIPLSVAANNVLQFDGVDLVSVGVVNAGNVVTDAAVIGGNLVISNSTPGGGITFADGSVQTTAGVTQIVAGTGVTITPPGGTGAVTINASGGGGSSTWATLGDKNNANGPQEIALGTEAGNTSAQGLGAIAIGAYAGNDNQGQGAVALGGGAGVTNQGANATAVGQSAGISDQGANAVAIGSSAGTTSQAPNSIVINATGVPLENTTADSLVISPIRNDTGNTTNVVYYNTTTKEVTYGPTGPANIILNGTSNVSIASADGPITMSVGGDAAGRITFNRVALGVGAGVGQAADAVAIGPLAGNVTQRSSAVAIGSEAGATNQGSTSVAIGLVAGTGNQGQSAVAVGGLSGQTSQGNRAVAVGSSAGLQNQSIQAVAVGSNAGQTFQGGNAVAIGAFSGVDNQGNRAIAIGPNAGANAQGINSIAIGSLAGGNAQAANSIVINATGTALENTTANAFVVKPVRIVSGAGEGNPPLGFFSMVYNPTTGEIAYWDGT